MNNKDYNFIFFGTPEVSVKILDILSKQGFYPSLIVTNPDALKGRGMHLSPSPVGVWANEHSIPCLKPEKLDSEFINKLKNINFNLSIVVAYGKIIPEKIISMPKLGTINIHYSLLPKYRGASPVEQALLKGDIETGVSIQQMQFKLDSGPILAEEKISINPDETKIDLLNRLNEIGGNLLLKVLPDIFEEKITAKKQDETQASYCKKIKKEDGLLDLAGDPILNYNKYRAFFGWPGTYFFKDEKRYKITKAKYENNSFILERVIPEGKKETNFNILK